MSGPWSVPFMICGAARGGSKLAVVVPRVTARRRQRRRKWWEGKWGICNGVRVRPWREEKKIPQRLRLRTFDLFDTITRFTTNFT